MRRALIVLAVACEGSPSPQPPVSPAVRVTPIDASVDVLPSTPPGLEVRHGNQLCIRDGSARACMAIGWQSDPTWTFGREPVATDDDRFRFRRGERLCLLTGGDRFECAIGGATSEVRTMWGGEHGYLHGFVEGNPFLAWFSPGEPKVAALRARHEPPERFREMRRFANGVEQLSVGYRLGCALSRGDVWCWSDPRVQRKLAAPRDVVDVIVQDVLAVCVRTKSGDVYCTPPDDGTGITCHPDKILCSKTSTPHLLRTGFDPLSRAHAPMKRVPLAHAATRVVRDLHHLHISRTDNFHVSDGETLGGCALGPANEVSCFAPCEGKAWGVVGVTGLPPDVVEIQSDVAAGYALTGGGELWTWSGRREPACGAAASIAATRVAIEPLAQLSEPLFHIGNLPQWTITRCAVTRAGAITCWSVDKRRGGVPATRFDPRALPIVKVL